MFNLTCISNDLKAQGIGFKSMTWKRFDQLKQADESYALFELGARWLNNVIVTRLHLQHCIANGWGYRVSSSLFPCLTHPEFSSDDLRFGVDVVLATCPQSELIKREFDLCKRLLSPSHPVDQLEFFGAIPPAIRALKVPIVDEQRAVYTRPRISTHPDHFNVLASEDDLAVSKSIKELNVHGWLLDQLGCPRDYSAPINIHVNNTQGNLTDIASRFLYNLEMCTPSVTSRLVIENEDRGCWTVDNLINHFYKEKQIPITFDNLHFKCNPSKFDEAQAMALCKATWKSVRPLFHYSESHPDKPNPRSHADMPTGSPPDFPADWDIELKSKDQAVRACAIFDEKQLQQVI